MKQTVDPSWLRFIPASLRSRLTGHDHLLKALSNSGWLFSDRILRMGTGLLVGVWVARYLGPTQFGLINFATAFVSLFAAVATLGLDGIVVRDLVMHPNDARTTLCTAFVLQLIGGVTAFVIAVAFIGYLRPDDTLSKSMVIILGLAMVFRATEVVKYWFESQVNSKYTILIEAIAYALFAGVKVVLIINHASVIAFVWVVLAEASLVSIGLLGIYTWQVGNIMVWPIQLKRATGLLKESFPLILSGLSVSLGMRLDQVMLNEMSGAATVGLYSAGVRLAEPLIFVGLVVAQSAYPRLIVLQGKAFEARFIAVIRYPFHFLFLSSMMIAAASPFLITLVFGKEYVNGWSALAILIFSIPITFVSVMSSQYLKREGLTNEIFKRQFIGLLINIAINLTLIPRYGIAGAAAATLLADIYIAFFSDIGHEKFKPLLALKLRSIFFLRHA